MKFLGGLSGPFSKVHASFRFKHVTEKFKAVALIQDPSGLPVDQLEMEIPEGKIFCMTHDVTVTSPIS